MLVGVPKEIKNHEYRVGMTPNGVREFVTRGHTVVVESKAGLMAGFSDELYLKAGASVLDSAEQVFKGADMIIKVKELQESEVSFIRKGQIIYSFLHLAAEAKLTQSLLDKGITAVAFESVTSDYNTLPVLTPMSEVAGRLATQVGSRLLEKPNGGMGILLGGVLGTEPARVTILGGGVSGVCAARSAIGTGGSVTIIEKSLKTIGRLVDMFGSSAKILYSNYSNIWEEVVASDLVIGAVLIHDSLTPKLVTKSMIKEMKEGAVVVDVSIDQGGCFETSRPTTHDDPTYVVDGVIHYCVSNMPGAVARTSTLALEHASIETAIKLADNGISIIKEDLNVRNGVNILNGVLVNENIASSLQKEYVPIIDLFHEI